MTREEAIRILSNYEELSCGFCHCGGDEVPQAFDMAVKALEAWGKVIEEITTEHDKALDVHFEEEWAYGKALKIIKKHLGEVENEQTER